jgi:hypothetical protein
MSLTGFALAGEVAPQLPITSSLLDRGTAAS